MPKLVKNHYYTSKGEKKVNSYFISVPKNVVLGAGIKETDNIKVYNQGNKIIIEKE